MGVVASVVASAVASVVDSVPMRVMVTVEAESTRPYLVVHNAYGVELDRDFEDALAFDGHECAEINQFDHASSHSDTITTFTTGILTTFVIATLFNPKPSRRFGERHAAITMRDQHDIRSSRGMNRDGIPNGGDVLGKVVVWGSGAHGGQVQDLDDMASGGEFLAQEDPVGWGVEGARDDHDGWFFGDGHFGCVVWSGGEGRAMWTAF